MPNNQATPEERPEETLGSRFRNARTDQGKTLPEAAQVTCINPTILANLEADNFTKMPAEVFTKGFIKLYAQYLGLDVNETVKLYVNKENLDPERPVEQPHRREVHTAAAMAHPRNRFRSNPKVMIIAILLALLLGFYTLGAILKLGQKHPDQAAPENELAKSLVEGNPQPLPGPAGEPPPAAGITEQTGVAGTVSLSTTLPEVLPGAGTAAGMTAAPYQPAANAAVPSSQPVTEKAAPATSATPEGTGAGRATVGTANGR